MNGGSPASDVLEAADALRHPGTLLSPDRRLVASYDLEMTDAPSAGYRRATQAGAGILNAAERPFRLAPEPHGTLHVINGMGVALGDSIVGLTALAALRERHPGRRIVLYRPSRIARHVAQLDTLAGDAIATMRTLPVPVDALPAPDLKIDLGNQLYRPSFATLPMIDYFLDALGVTPAEVGTQSKRNRWLARLDLPALPEPWRTRRYALVCADASTPLRSFPDAQRAAIVERVARRYGLPVLGFGPVDRVDRHVYTDVRALSPDTAAYLAWIRGAAVLISADTSAIHAADGFDVPTLACFTSIAPALRVRDYPHCVPVSLALPPALRDRHASDDAGDVAAVAAAFRELDWDGLNWPAARDAAR